MILQIPSLLSYTSSYRWWMPGPTSPKVPGIVLIPCLRILLSSALSTFPPNSPLQKLKS